MALNLNGYVLEKPRVGQSNNPLTFTPTVSAGPGFTAFFTSAEIQPEHGYLLLCLQGGKLPGCIFGWTRNETLQRFSYQGSNQAFLPLPGEGRRSLGFLSADSNTQRLKVRVPVSTNLASYPLRVSLSPNLTLTAVVVPSFGVPAPSTIEISQTTGELNWAANLLSTYEGVEVFVQDQTFPEKPSSLGSLGSDLYLNPIPATGQFPRVRFGWGLPLTAIEVPNESSFPALVAGTFAWAADTGKLAFSAVDITTFSGYPVYYDGVLLNVNSTLTSQNLGSLAIDGFAAGLIVPPPLDGPGDVLVTVNGYTFPTTKLVSVFSSVIPRGTVEVLTSTGAVKVGPEDAATYVGFDVIAIPCDINTEHDVVFRLFRSLADPSETDPTVPDCTSIVEVMDQKWAEPIQSANPLLFLPCTPIDDGSYPTVLKVLQGSGSYLSSNFPRLDRLLVSDPYDGLGYVPLEESRQLFFAKRVRNRIYTLSDPSTSLSLEDPTIQSKGLFLEEETFVGSGVYSPLIQNETVVLDTSSGTLVFTDPHGALVRQGNNGSVSLTVFTDPESNAFSNVLPGDDVLFGGKSYRVVTVDTANQLTLSDSTSPSLSSISYQIRRNPEVLAHRVWTSVPTNDPSLSVTRTRTLGPISNSPRLGLDPTEIGRTVIVFSDDTVSSSVTLVTTFTNPAVLPSQEVEVDSDGFLNFSDSQVILGGNVRAKVIQRAGVDFRVTPALGYFDMTYRFFAFETGEVTYRRSSDQVLVVQPITFLRRKVVLDHPNPTDVVLIPTENRTVVTTPEPKFWRSGRPQTYGVDYQINGSTLEILPSTQVTKAFPAGIPLNPSEQALLDFYVLEAMGGEKNFTTLSPIYSPSVGIVAGATTFTIPGDVTALLVPNSFLRFDGGVQVSEVVSSSFSSGVTSIQVYAPFFETLNNPKIEVCEPLRTVAPTLGRVELTPVVSSVIPSPRGMSTFSLTGDATAFFKTGTILSLRGLGFRDAYYVSGSKVEANATTVTLGSPLVREYPWASTSLWVSQRPVVEPGTTKLQTISSPLTTPIVSVGVEGVSGDTALVVANTSGEVTLPNPLQPGQEVVASYLGSRTVEGGKRIRATYVSYVAPDTVTNGLAGQKLRADFSLYTPDSFYARVVPMGLFRQEIEQELLAAANGTSSGPTTENASTPSLSTSGLPSLFWEEGHLQNSDLAAKSYLLFYHTLANSLDRVMSLSDGSIPGAEDGPFRYDGNSVLQSSVQTASNQIDDLIAFPSYPTQAYRAGFQSRFFPTTKAGFNTSLNTSVENAPIFDLKTQWVSGVVALTTRMPWGMVLTRALAGDTLVLVDSVASSATLLRPGFQVGMEVVIVDSAGAYLVPPSSPLVISGFFGNFILFAPGLPVEIPVGATVTRSPSDASLVVPAVVNHQQGRDFNLDSDNGLVLYHNPQPPYDGSDPLVPVSLRAKPVPSNTDLTWSGSFRYSDDFPYRFPALDGLATNDDGDTTIPLSTPSFYCEQNEFNRGLLSFEEDTLIAVDSLTLPSSTFGSVDVDVTGTILTRTIPLLFPVGIRQHDLVRFNTGLNASNSYRRIVSATVNSITLDGAFPALADSGVFIDVVLDLNGSSTGDLISGGSVLEDLSNPFSDTDVGKTIIVTSGGDTGERRQIVSYVSSSQVTLDTALTPAVGVAYRLSNALVTYGGTGSYSDTYNSISSDLVSLYTEFSTEISNFFTTLFETQVASVTGQTILPDVFQDLLSDFSSLSLNSYLYVTSGVDVGIYPILAVLSSTSVQVGAGSSPGFTANAAGLAYQIVTFDATLEPSFVYTLFNQQRAAEVELASVQAFVAQFLTLAPILGLPVARATPVRQADLVSRLADNAARQVVAPTLRSILTPPLESNPGLYDLRYAWITARIHRIQGYLPRIERAVQVRNDAIREQRNRLLLLNGGVLYAMQDDDTTEIPSPPPPEWKSVERFPIQDQMVDVLKKAKAVAELELAELKRKLHRMKYGALRG